MWSGSPAAPASGPNWRSARALLVETSEGIWAFASDRPADALAAGLIDRSDGKFRLAIDGKAFPAGPEAVDAFEKIGKDCEQRSGWQYGQDDDKQMLPASSRSNIAAALVGVFDSQVTGGKRYDLATAGRRLANATYFASHGTDQESALNFGMDLTPLVEDPSLDVATYVLGFVDRFRADVEKRVKAWAG